MSIKTYRPINVRNPDLMRVQDSVKETFSSLVRAPILNSNPVVATLTTSPTEVSHGLNRNIQGWFIIRQNAQAAIWEPSESDTPNKTVRLEASAAVTVTIYFF